MGWFSLWKYENKNKTKDLELKVWEDATGKIRSAELYITEHYPSRDVCKPTAIPMDVLKKLQKELSWIDIAEEP